MEARNIAICFRNKRKPRAVDPGEAVVQEGGEALLLRCRDRDPERRVVPPAELRFSARNLRILYCFLRSDIPLPRVLLRSPDHFLREPRRPYTTALSGTDLDEALPRLLRGEVRAALPGRAPEPLREPLRQLARRGLGRVERLLQQSVPGPPNLSTTPPCLLHLIQSSVVWP